MNIAYFHNDVWPPHEGSSVHSWQIYSRLRRFHTIYTLNSCPFPEAHHSYKNIQDAWRMLKSIDIVFIILEGNFDFHTEKFSILPALFALHKPVVWRLQSPIEESLLLPGYNRINLPMHRFKRRFFSSFVDVCICVSNVLEKYATKNLLAKKYTVCANGSDPSIFRHINIKKIKNKYSKNKPFIVLWAGGDNSWQATDLIVKIAEIMIRIDPTVVFRLISSIQLSRFPSLPNLQVIKAKSYFEMGDEMAKADIALSLYYKLLPCGFYNSPLKLFDAMSSGLVVIGTNIGQINEVIINKKNGFLTNNDPAEIIETIRLLKNNFRLAQAIGAEARKTVLSYYNWDRTVREINTIFESVANVS